jgi:hypothetical protein
MSNAITNYALTIVLLCMLVLGGTGGALLCIEMVSRVVDWYFRLINRAISYRTMWILLLIVVGAFCHTWDARSLEKSSVRELQIRISYLESEVRFYMKKCPE